MVNKLRLGESRIYADESGRLHNAIAERISTIRMIMSEIKESLDAADKYERNLHINGEADDELYDVLFKYQKNLVKFQEALDSFYSTKMESVNGSDKSVVLEGYNDNYYEVVDTVDGIPSTIIRKGDNVKFRIVRRNNKNGYQIKAMWYDEDQKMGQWDYSKEYYDTPEEASNAMINFKATFRNL